MRLPFLALVSAVVLSGCGESEPWWLEGKVYVQTTPPAVSQVSGGVTAAPYGAQRGLMVTQSSGRWDDTAAIGPGQWPDNQVIYRDRDGNRVSAGEVAQGGYVVYEEVADCANPNSSYAIQHMAGRIECGVLHEPGTLTHAANGARNIIYRDWLGRGYARGEDGRWVRASTYDMVAPQQHEEKDKN